MKYSAVAMLAFWCAGAFAAPPQPIPASAPPPPDLRQLLQQYHGGSSAAPRQLTEAERAELRRQLSEYSQPVMVRRASLKEQ